MAAMRSTIDIYLGMQMRRIRLAMGMTQKELAAQLGCKPATVSQWVNHRNYPPSDRLAHICAVLQVSADWLLGLSVPNERETAGIRWMEQIPDHILLEQQREIVQGIDIFHHALEGQRSIHDLTAFDGPFPVENWKTLTRAFTAAMPSGRAARRKRYLAPQRWDRLQPCARSITRGFRRLPSCLHARCRSGASAKARRGNGTSDHA